MNNIYQSFSFLDEINQFINRPYEGPFRNRTVASLQLPFLFVWHTLGTAAGVVHGLRLGRGKSFLMTHKITAHSRFIFATPYLCFLKMINPNAKIGIQHLGSKNDPHPRVRFRGNGLVNDIVMRYLLGHVVRKYDPEVLANMTTRLTFAVAAVAATVARAVDGIIGATAGTAAILTAGYFESLNHLAFKGLQFTGVVADWQLCGIGFVNPSAVVEQLSKSKASSNQTG